ncbi:MAG: (Fe-S)-binding protein, partial [bacterium]|nr:(Fe-S)-binding protein [bacterium]
MNSIDSEIKKSYSYYTEPMDLLNRPERFLKVFASILEHTNYRYILDLYSKLSTKCSRCTVSCQIYQASNKPEDIPCYRSELLLKVYRRHFTYKGLFDGRVFGKKGLTDEDIDEMAESFYHCTACRRCTLECPMGIEHGLVTHLGRWILAEIGIIPKALVVATREQLEGNTANTSAIPAAAMMDTCEFLEEEIMEIKEKDIKFPIDVEDSEYIFFPAVSDFLLEPDTLMGNAAVMHATGGSWTIGTKYFDGINYGLFYSDIWLKRIVQKEVDELNRLKAKKIMIGECGHATRTAKQFVPVFCGGQEAPEVVNCMEYAYEMLQKGKLKLNPDVVTEKITYHDPCNIARNGWIVDQPREILKSFVKNFVEMTPNGKDNLCCGGGGGIVSIDEVRKYRTGVIGKKKADQIRDTGAEVVVAPCANCKKQIR